MVRPRLAGDATAELDARIRELRRRMHRGPELEPGEFLAEGRFELVESIGKGGFARVWKAWDEDLRRPVAVKVIHPHHLEEKNKVRRFFRGARKMAALQHQHVVQVIEPEMADDMGWRFFVMELVDGPDLERAVKEGVLASGDRLRIVRQVAEALELAHAQGLVHRDVKPSNVLLDGELRPKLTDFDLVRGDDTTGFTATQAMMGTLSYAAPEILGSPRDAGPPADVYSLASTAVFVLRGAALPAHYYRDPGSAIAELDVAPELARVLVRATAAEPQDRYPSMPAFVAALYEASTEVVEAPAVEVQLPSDRAEGFDDLFSTFLTPQGERKELWCEIPADEGWIGEGETRHRVRVIRPFWMSAVPVTNAQYAAFDREKPPENWKGVSEDELSSHPRVRVRWQEAVKFCEWLAEQGLEGARLPTEEEWEYACRAGSDTSFWNGDDEDALDRVGWYGANSDERTHRVGGKLASPWGLYDVHGNVWEWTASVWESEKYQKLPRDRPFEVDPSVEPADLAAPSSPRDRRVMRGGSFWSTADGARSSYRNAWDPGIVRRNQGFRVLLPSAPRR